MVNNNNRRLLILFIMFLTIDVFILMTILGVTDIDITFTGFFLGIASYLLTAFFLQLLVLRITKRRLIRAVPPAVIAAAGLATLIKALLSDGWDSLGWILIFFIFVGMAVGCVLGWTAYMVYPYFKKRNPLE